MLRHNNFTLIPRWVGGKINWPGQLTPPTLQLSIQNNPTKKTAELYLNYVYD